MKKNTKKRQRKPNTIRVKGILFPECQQREVLEAFFAGLPLPKPKKIE
ncbi:MAG: hypothetical protein H7A46_22795 [Verrucomicrobiales bacterium]|nr:hypothetical protein [Verrucomicrobiales bacterium]